ncbi:hypothetical protein PVAND_005612 [Polypedilum vanderplanki]|uniref:RAP domain-containing protein n=1 Tax=Polypedilum vanderplanki TaxID=319348 RepID=A0A9J6C2K8_POLVA|nr:hypothetical protein PVAND_005612 [Polypedilum vanderplanki]
MFLRVVSKSFILNRVVNQIVHNVRHQGSYRVSSLLTNISPMKQIDVRSLSDNFEEDEIEENYNVADLANKYFSCGENQKDDLMNEIDKYEEIDEVTKCLEENLEKLQKRHLIKLLLMTGKLRDKNNLTVVKNIKEVVDKINKMHSEIKDENELGIIILFLRLLGVKRTNETMQNLINKIQEIFKEKEEESSLFALSCFSEMMALEKDLYSRLVLVDVTVPIIKKKFKVVNNEMDYFHLISCLNNIHGVVSQESMTEYKNKIEELLDKKIISSTPVLFKTINFLNYPYWSTLNGTLIQKLLLLLQDRVETMDAKELIQTNKALFVQYEPASLIKPLRNQALALLEKTEDISLLQIVCMYCSPDERIRYATIFKDKILKYQSTIGPQTGSLATFFKILRLLRISDDELCDCFWTKIVNKIFSLTLPDLKYQLSKYFQKYMNFNNNLGGTYRHIEFEKIVYEYCIEEMKTTSAYIPKDFVKFASFVIAYSDRYESIPPFVIEKLIMMQEQFSLYDCRLLARALEIIISFKNKTTRSVTLDNQIEIIQYILDICAQRHMKDNIDVKDMNLILTSYVRRKASRDSQLFYEIMNWYNNNKLDLNSRKIREICHALQVTKFSNETVCDQFINYVVENKDYVTGETVEKILTTCYNLSYFPDDMQVFDKFNEILNRDFNVMTGLSIVQSLLALTFYKSAPFELVTKVFNSDFIKRLEQEIEMAYSKNTYPRRVMTLIMQLNRAICLDHPEYNIRWFQQNFIEAQMSKKPIVKSKFHDEVHRLLLNIVPSQNYLAINKTTPYGYRIDFELHIDENYNKFLKIDPNDYLGVNFKPKVNKIAIILLGFDTFCINDVNRLRGSELLRMRHLEMMNYRVIHVKKSDFKMLYENVAAKINHLKKLLEISG